MPRPSRSEFTANQSLDPLTFTPYSARPIRPPVGIPVGSFSWLPWVTWGTLAGAVLWALFA